MTSALALGGCATLLGGLEDGTAPAIAMPDAMTFDTAPAVVPDRSDWLLGFTYRVRYEVNSAEPDVLGGYSIRLGIDTHAPIAARRMRENGADLRVTSADGRSLLPHWLAPPLNADATSLWTRLDLAPGRNVVFVYYGNDAAEPTSDVRTTFVAGVISNPSFDGTTPWTATPPTNGEPGTLQMQSQQASVALARPAAIVPSSLGWCQPIVLPSGARHRVIFDLTTTQADRARVMIWIDGVDGTAVFTGEGGAGRGRSLETAAVGAGPTTLCLGGRAMPDSRPQTLAAYFENLRLRVDAPTNPVADPPFPEERR